MSHNLCISVTLLDGRFHGAADNKKPEWPPSPWRLFQALLAGVCTGRGLDTSGNDIVQALKWLEGKEPLIVAPKSQRMNGYRIFVPNNDLDVLAKAWAKGVDPPKTLAELRTQKDILPQAMVDGNTVHYLYTLSEQDRQKAEMVATLAHRLHTFGWGIDAACASGRLLTATEVEQLPGVCWRPRPEVVRANTMLRVPQEGALVDLVKCHEQSTHRIAGKQFKSARRSNRFGTVSYLADTEVPPRQHVVFNLRAAENSDRAQAFRQEDASVVAAMLRSLACRLAQRDTHQFPGGSEVYVAGHTGNGQDTPPRFSYLALPSIGHPHADGMIRRVMIAEPHGGDGSQVMWAANRLRAQVLTGDGGRAVAVLYLDSESDKKVVPLYCATRKAWESVTPVILPGYDEHKPGKDDQRATKAERLFLKAVGQAGLQPQGVAGFMLRRAPFWPGSLHPRQYRRPDYLKDHHARPSWHVHVEFHEAITGPIAIGAGRHCGLGLFAAVEE